MSIDSQSHFSAKDDKIHAIVRAKYTYGKFVKGDAIVSISLDEQFGYVYPRQAVKYTNVIKSIKIDGKGSVEFDVESIHPVFSTYTSSLPLKIHATVIEELTGEYPFDWRLSLF